MDKLVSIIIPVYNRVTLVVKAIETAINQTYSNIEVVIVDNCSTDGTWDVLQQYANKDQRIKVFRNAENIGPVRNWEACLNQCKGEFVKVLFSDDWLPIDYIEKTVPLLTPDVGFVLTAATVFDNSSNVTTVKYQLFKSNKILRSDDYLKKVLMGFNFSVSPGCALFRAEDVKKNLLIEIPNDENLTFSRYGAGNDKLIFLLTANSYRYLAYSNDVTAVFLGHAGSISISENIRRYYDLSDVHFANVCNNNSLKNFLYTFYVLKRNALRLKIVNGKFDYLALYELLIYFIKKKIYNGSRGN